MSKEQLSIFNEIAEDKKAELEPTKMDLIPILKKDKKEKLTPIQKKFNKLSQEINKQKELFDQLPENEAYIREYYKKNIAKIHTVIKEKGVDNLRNLDNWYESGKISKKRLEYLADLILDESYFLRDNYMKDEEVSLLVEEMLDKYIHYVYGISPAERKKEEVLEMAEMVKNMFDMDLDDIAAEASDMDDFMNKTAERMENEYKENEDEDIPKAETSKKVAKEKVQEQLEQKSLRKIYIELVRQLHPDKVKDEAEKQVKENQMKQLTEAYRNKDLYALLRMQMNWMTESEQDFTEQPDDVLKQYIKIMKSQLETLQDEYHSLAYRTIPDLPRRYSQYLIMNKTLVKYALAREKKNQEKLLKIEVSLKAYLGSKKEINEYLNDYIRSKKRG